MAKRQITVWQYICERCNHERITIVRDMEKKQRVMFAPEAPEVLFEDYGVGQLVNGRARIEIDPVFAANITVNEKHPPKVFIQLEGDCNGVFVTDKTAAGFEVIELAGDSAVFFRPNFSFKNAPFRDA